MLRGFYTAASGMLAQQRRTELLTNNLSNANTTGYKADQSSVRSFPEMLLSNLASASGPSSQLNQPSSSRVGSLSTGVYVQEANPSFIQGTLEETGLNTDISLADVRMPVDEETKEAGTVLFTVENENGELRYTRNGSFTLDGQGNLTTPDGLYVLDDNQQRINLGSDQFTVSETGEILENGRQTARLGIGYADRPSLQLSKDGEGLYTTENELASAFGNEEIGFSVKQGSLEASNVDESRSMTEMMAAYRSFESNQKVLQAYDKSLDKAVNEVGKV